MSLEQSCAAAYIIASVLTKNRMFARNNFCCNIINCDAAK